MTDHLALAGKIGVVTGAGGAIGAAVVRLMLERGASVAAVDRPGTDFDALRASVGGAASLHCIEADVRSEPDVEKYVAETQHTFGRIDVFFNNAGVEGAVAPIPQYPLATFHEVLAVNVVGVFLGLKHVIPAMAATGGGAIVNTSSVAGLIGSPGLSAYIASKHAVIGLTRTAAIECGPMKIRVNSVNPGPVESRMMRSLEHQSSPGAPEAAHAQFEKIIPFGRYASCDEVAQLVCFLASDEAAYLTGGIYVVDGGMTAG